MSKKDREKKQKQDGLRTVVGVAWYRREQWNRLLEMSSDRDKLEDTFDEWKSSAEKQFDNLARSGFLVRKVDIDVDELLSWCDSKNRPVDGEARADYTATTLREREQSK